MFGDLFGNVEQQQEELQKKLATIEVTGDAGRFIISSHYSNLRKSSR